MNDSCVPGRHRAPGQHKPLNELRVIARESGQPAFKGLLIIAAAGGLVASFATAAGAETQISVTGDTVVAPAMGSVVGPDVVNPHPTSALAAIGFTPLTTAQPAVATVKPAVKPLVIEDITVKQRRAELARQRAVAAAKGEAEAQARAARAEAARAQAARAEAIRAGARDRAEAQQQAAARKRALARQEAARPKSQLTWPRQTTSQRTSRTTTRNSLSTSTSVTTSSKSPTTPTASRGAQSSRNWATRGQCTWGALAKWKASEGYYPSGWTGNASSWGWAAQGAGYTVGSTPRTRSFVVMQPGVHGSSSAGHVAWVTSVDGNTITVVEMNALAGPFNFNTRTLTHLRGMRYIYAP